ncbi:hypothetical protein CAPTEDRAFT_217496 [Capitella teleta]|uniref:Endonuclease/exonuclease/phosphatase domain-containing protein n=1 Tax=Capitella teleta TaxID=283909 RepID=R7UQH2_CAPTE|nr:hypothetical protein CAPTEDRAFT_217496 [Capitella teleta]|eukprot:ELU05651.1 hypothetical protein CAPTEDRAFT_217496 [Capitella teleta]
MHRGGCALLIRHRMVKYIVKVDVPDPECIMLKLQLFPKITFVSCYIAPSDSPYHSYAPLSEIQERVSENDDEKSILIGDRNARFGNERTAFIEGKNFPMPTHYAPSPDPATSTNVNARCLFLWFKPDSRQAGSQPGRGCTEHLITLTLWIDYAKHKKKKLYLKCRTANTPCARYIRSLDQHDYDHEDQILKEKARTSTRTKYRSYCNPMNPELKKHEIYTDINVKEYARLTTTRFRLSSHNLAIECGRWLRKRPEKRV